MTKNKYCGRQQSRILKCIFMSHWIDVTKIRPNWLELNVFENKKKIGMNNTYIMQKWKLNTR
jgi:hypothetical protein